MIARERVLLADKYNQPPIPLVDLDTGEKIKLRLRRMSFRREISSLPSDMLQLHELLISRRGERNAAIYNMVACYEKLRVYPDFWTTFQFSSESEYLAYYALPDGRTLAAWLVMVNLFEKATFILLGDDVLSYMLRAVGQHEESPDGRKKAYQEIFNRYCSLYDSFDKTAFFDVMRRFVQETYEQPQAEAAGLKHEEWTRLQHQRRTGVTVRREIVPTEEKQQFGPKIQQDFKWNARNCPYCVSKNTIILDFQRYTDQLEQIISENLGHERIPERPLAIRDLVLDKENIM